MNGVMNTLVDQTVQCWGCPVFDRLFQIVSDAAGAVYGHFAFICAVLFCVMFAFFVLNAVWQNIKGGVSDPWYAKSVQPVLINSIVAMVLLGMGVYLPRFVTSVTFEPAAQIALAYTQSMIHMDSVDVNERVTYVPEPMSDDGFYRPQLRDTVIMLMKTTITQFQSYMKLGIAVMDSAFSWSALLGVGALIRHIIIFVIGLYLVYGFFKLFLRFCFYFADLIVAMTFFAFFFPLSLVMTAFKGAQHVPAWMGNIGKGLGTDQFKNLINAIISLAAAVITYTVIMVIIAKFFASSGTDTADLMHLITTGDVFAADLSDENVAGITLMGAIVLIYVLNFIYGQIPQVTKMILGAFNVSNENKLSEQLADDAMKLAKNIANAATTAGKALVDTVRGADGDGKTDKADKKESTGK